MTADSRGAWRNWPAKYPKYTLFLSFVFLVLAILATLRLKIDTSIEHLFPEDSPAARSLVRVLNDFSAAEELLVLVSLPNSSGSEPPDVDRLLAFAARLDAAVKASPEARELTPGITYQVDDQTKAFFEKVVVPAGLFYLDDTAFESAKQRLTLEEMRRQFRLNEALVSAPGPAAQALAKAFLQDPLRLHEFIMKPLEEKRPLKTFGNRDAFLSPDGRSLLIRIPGTHPPSDLDFARRFTRFIADATARVNADGLKIDLAGAYPIAAFSEKSIRADMVGSVISSALFLQGLFLFAYRRPFRTFMFAFLPVVMGIGYGFGVQSVISHSLTPLTAVIGGILAGMGIDYTIHYLAQYDATISRGLSPSAAALDTIRTIGSAQLAGWVTSAIGFFAVGWSSVPALREFAIVGSLGLAGTLLGSVVILPAALQLFTSKLPVPGTPTRHRGSILSAIEWIERKKKTVFAWGVSLLISSVAIVAGSKEIFPFENDLKVMHPRPNPPLDAQDLVAKRMGISAGSLIIHLTADSDEELVQLAHRVDRRLRSSVAREGGIIGTYGLATLLPDPESIPSRIAATGGTYADRVMNDFRSVASKSIFDQARFEPYEGFLRSVLTRADPPRIADLIKYPGAGNAILPRSAFIAGTKAAHDSIVLVFTAESMDDRDQRARAILTVRTAFSDLPGATPTGLSVVGYDTEEQLRHRLPRLFFGALIAVMVFLFVHYRSLSDAALALLPAVFSLTVLAAVMHLAGQKINTMNLISVPLLIGMDTDYGIFVVTLARLQRRRNEDLMTTLRNLAPSMHANVLCACATILGFGSLVTTSVPAIRSLGFVVAVGVAACLVGTFGLLMPLILIANSRKSARAGGRI